MVGRRSDAHGGELESLIFSCWLCCSGCGPVEQREQALCPVRQGCICPAGIVAEFYFVHAGSEHLDDGSDLTAPEGSAGISSSSATVDE
jgi:hypothetical protein